MFKAITLSCLVALVLSGLVMIPRNNSNAGVTVYIESDFPKVVRSHKGDRDITSTNKEHDSQSPVLPKPWMNRQLRSNCADKWRDSNNGCYG